MYNTPEILFGNMNGNNIELDPDYRIRFDQLYFDLYNENGQPSCSTFEFFLYHGVKMLAVRSSGQTTFIDLQAVMEREIACGNWGYTNRMWYRR